MSEPTPEEVRQRKRAITCARNAVRWRLVSAATVLAVLPAGAFALADRFDDVTCLVTKAKVTKGAEITPEAVTTTSVSRAKAGRDAVSPDGVTPRSRAARSIDPDSCVRASMVLPPLLKYEFATFTPLGTPKAGGTVDLLFAPTGSQDSRDGASVDGVLVDSYAATKIVVKVTADQQRTILKHVARSQLTVRAN